MLTLVKPLFVFILGCVVFPRRALAAGIVGLIPLTVGRWGVVSRMHGWTRPEHLWSGPFLDRAGGLPYWSAQRILAAVVLIVLSTAFVFVAFITYADPLPKRPGRV